MKTTKDKVLSMLYSNCEGISGEEIAGKLSITRNSVWKAIKALKNDGYEIVSCIGRGYMLKQDKDVLDEYSLCKYLSRDHKIYVYDIATSSNTIGKELCQKGEDEGTVIIVKSQTRGRGRMGRSFISSDENGLYMSVILRPGLPAEECTNITVMCAVAVLEAIEETSGKECEIKWVNDIYINDKKCCGILTEGAMDFESGYLQYAVVGIGINLCEPRDGFDEEIADIATGIYEGKRYPDNFKTRLCAKIINRLFDRYETFKSKDYIQLYREKSNIIGKTVDVYTGNGMVTGIAVDIDENASLVVQDENGERHTFSSGEARVRKAGEKLS
ncbi:MAG: biotin--[acetyl-CoA-carboxylase] ligase [Clostridia bacterium]|nr:biotin--[acetyl-CoA-carboxylase] ligase [Clostridia bacterium]